MPYIICISNRAARPYRRYKMEYAIRTTEAFPKYLQAYWGSAKDINWTSADTKTRTWEDAAQQFNKIEAAAILEELTSAGIKAEIC
jgi:hypothetical protein